MNSGRNTSLTAGLLSLLTFVSIPTLSLYGSVKGADYITSGSSDTAAIVGALLEVIVALASIGTAVVLFPILKKQSEVLALSLVAARILEASTIFMGVACLMTIVTLHQTHAGAGALASAHALSALYDRIFLQGQSFMPAINDILLGVLLYKSRLVPRALSLLGIIGSFSLLAGYIAVMCNATAQHGPVAGLAALPVALFEFSLGLWLVLKGFNSQAIVALESR